MFWFLFYSLLTLCSRFAASSSGSQQVRQELEEARRKIKELEEAMNDLADKLVDIEATHGECNSVMIHLGTKHARVRVKTGGGGEAEREREKKEQLDVLLQGLYSHRRRCLPYSTDQTRNGAQFSQRTRE